MKIRNYVFGFISVVFFCGLIAAQQPLTTVKAFYKFDGTHDQVFNRKNIDARKRWLSDELYSLLLKELDREKEYLKQHPDDKPRFGDGLPFRPLDESCEANGRSYSRTLQFGAVTVKGELGNVDVRFVYPKVCGIRSILYAVNMSKEKGRWVIDDVRYIPDNTSLAEILRRKEY